MPGGSARIAGLRTVASLCILTIVPFGHAQAQSQITPNGGKTPPSWSNDNNPRNWPYDQKTFARVFGNIGGWWSFLNENEKAAFLDGFKSAMAQSLSRNEVICKSLKDSVKPSSDQQAFTNQMAAVLYVCGKVGDFSGFEKITTKDLDDFYSDPVNQPILLEWSMAYLRDKATGRKTKRQLLDALKAEQKDVHDCSKYPHLCKLGIQEPGASQ